MGQFTPSGDITHQLSCYLTAGFHKADTSTVIVWQSHKGYWAGYLFIAGVWSLRWLKDWNLLASMLSQTSSEALYNGSKGSRLFLHEYLKVQLTFPRYQSWKNLVKFELLAAVIVFRSGLLRVSQPIVAVSGMTGVLSSGKQLISHMLRQHIHSLARDLCVVFLWRVASLFICRHFVSKPLFWSRIDWYYVWSHQPRIQRFRSQCRSRFRETFQSNILGWK